MNTTQDLFAAIEAGDQRGVETLLIADPARARERNASGNSLILFALYRGQRGLIPTITAAGAPLDIFDAAALGHSARVRELLTGDPSLAHAHTKDGFTALHYTVFFSGDVETVRGLLDAGANPEAVAQNPMRVRPLHSALAGRNHELARLLIEKGANVNAQQEGGFTALMEAAQNGHMENVEYMLAHGADATAKADDGRTAVDIAAAAGHAEIAARLRQ